MQWSDTNMIQAPENPKDAPFNMAMMFYFRINQLMAEKDKAAIMGDVHAWYACLKAIYRNIVFNIDEGEDRDLFEQKFKQAYEQLTTSVGVRALQHQVDQMTRTKAGEILDEIDKDLMIIMDKKKMIFPRIELTGGLEKLGKKYGLVADG